MPFLFQWRFLTEGKGSLDPGFPLWLLSLAKIAGQMKGRMMMVGVMMKRK